MLSESSQGLNEINGLIQVLFDKTKLRELICESRCEWWRTWLLKKGHGRAKIVEYWFKVN